jgi:hypothetical protein
VALERGLLVGVGVERDATLLHHDGGEMTLRSKGQPGEVTVHASSLSSD